MKTAYMLMAEFNKACISINELIDHGYLDMNRKTANAMASKNQLPFPAFRLIESQKASYHVHIDELAKWIDACNQAAVKSMA